MTSRCVLLALRFQRCSQPAVSGSVDHSRSQYRFVHRSNSSGLLQIRQEISNGLQAIFIKNADVQTSLDEAKTRSDAILRRFQQTYAGKTLP